MAVPHLKMSANDPKLVDIVKRHAGTIEAIPSRVHSPR
jgi:hypothetical protein